VGFEFSWTDKHGNPFVAEGLHASLEGQAGGGGGVDERQDDNGDAQSNGLVHHAESVVVGDPVGELVDGVEGGWGDDDGTSFGRAGLAGFAVRGAHRAASLFFQSTAVDEGDRGRGGDDLDSPAFFLGQADEGADIRGGSGSAHHDVERCGSLSHAEIPARWCRVNLDRTAVPRSREIRNVSSFAWE